MVRRWRVLVSSVVAVACVAGAVWAARPDRAPEVEPEETTDPLAYRHGGRPPLGGVEIETLFSEDLATFLLHLDYLRRAREHGAMEVDWREQNLRSLATIIVAETGQVLNRDAASFMEAVLDQSLRLTVDGRAAAVGSYLRSVDALNASLEDAGIGFYVDAEVRGEPQGRVHRVYLATFVVDRVRLYRAGDTPVRVLRLVRADRLNFARSVLGFTRPHLRDALVLLERVEGFLVGSVLPALADGASMRLVDAETRKRKLPWVSQVERVAAQVVREQSASLYRNPDALWQLADVMGRRERFFRRLAAQYDPRRVIVVAPQTYSIDEGAFTRSTSLLTRGDERELRALADELDAPEAFATYRVLYARMLESVEEHEAQHRLDFLEPGGPVPQELSNAASGLDARTVARAGAELSAYLSELAREQDLTQLNLALLARYALDGGFRGSAEHYAARVILEGLARRTGALDLPRVEEGRLIRARVADDYLSLTRLAPTELSAVARRMWAELFQHPLPELQHVGG